MRERKSRQGEGYDFSDYEEILFNAGLPPLVYIAGANARAAVPLMLLDEAIWPISETYPAIPAEGFPALGCPHNVQNTLFYSDQECQIRLVSRELIARWVASVVAGAPLSVWPIPVVQITIPATTWITLPDKWAIIYVVGTGAIGTLNIKMSG